jgi:hypothetical protein
MPVLQELLRDRLSCRVLAACRRVRPRRTISTINRLPPGSTAQVRLVDNSPERRAPVPPAHGLAERPGRSSTRRSPIGLRLCLDRQPVPCHRPRLDVWLTVRVYHCFSTKDEAASLIQNEFAACRTETIDLTPQNIPAMKNRSAESSRSFAPRVEVDYR